MLLSAGRAAINRYLLLAGPTAAKLQQGTPYRIDPAPHRYTILAVQIFQISDFAANVDAG